MSSSSLENLLLSSKQTTWNTKLISIFVLDDNAAKVFRVDFQKQIEVRDLPQPCEKQFHDTTLKAELSFY